MEYLESSEHIKRGCQRKASPAEAIERRNFRSRARCFVFCLDVRRNCSPLLSPSARTCATTYIGKRKSPELDEGGKGAKIGSVFCDISAFGSIIGERKAPKCAETVPASWLTLNKKEASRSYSGMCCLQLLSGETVHLRLSYWSSMTRENN